LRNPKPKYALMKKRIFLWIKIAIIIYCLIGIGLYYFQDRFIFQPEELPADYEFKFPFPHKEINLPYTENSNINIVQFSPEDTDTVKGVVLYFHGNGQNIERYSAHVPFFTKNNYAVWMIDYPGYGKSTGELSEKMLYEWALIFYKLARASFPAEKIILYGRSLGTGIAAQLASIRDCKALVLEAPFYSLPSLAGAKTLVYPVKNIIKYKFPTYEYLPQIIAPIIIFHGTDDSLIPISQGKRLAKLLTQKDKFIPVEGAGHNNVMNFPDYKNALDSLLR
jgi:pimeloyl-ACP methyl ester carboxylesterase